MNDPEPLRKLQGLPLVSSQLTTILILFVVLRMTVLFLYTPQGLLNSYTDYFFYYRTALLSEQGYYPYVNMWYVYPPLTTYLVQGVYLLTRSFLPMGDINSLGFMFFSRLLGMTLLIFESGVLILTHKIVNLVWDLQRANWVGWVYASLSLPLFYWSASHSTVVVFFMLLGVYLFIQQRRTAASISFGLGIAAKLTPVVLLGPVVRDLWPRRKLETILCVLLALLVVAVTYLPFLLIGGAVWVAASFKAIGGVGSWSTLWALVDGNWGWADYGPLENQLQLAMAAVQHGHPAVIPEWFKLAGFGLLYAFLFFGPFKHRRARHFVWFSTLTMLIFLLWSKGWSPQWGTMIIPLLLISFPGRRGLGLVLLLTGATLIEWPLADAFNIHALAAVAILGRTALLALAAIWAAMRLWQPGGRNQKRPV